MTYSGRYDIMPKKPPVACTVRGCSRLAKAGDGGLCSFHITARHKDYQKSRSDQEHTKIYGTKAWALSRKAALIRDSGWCVRCKEKPAALVDHIKEIKDGGQPFALENLQSLCVSCHGKKTKEVATNR